MFCDIHTHNLNPRFPSLVDVSGSEDFVFSRPDAYFSMGIHPRNVADGSQARHQLDKIQNAAANGLIRAIGECGLDKFASWSRDAGRQVFADQLDIAAEYGLPVVVHCVKLYSDIINILKNKRFANPVILHSYNGNSQTTEQLLRLGNIYFSFCQLTNSTGLKSLPLIPAARILLESDAMDFADFQTTIDTIAGIKKIDSKSLEDIIFYNFVKIIG